ncbi:MAG: ABC transporter permease [Candidatus Aenigmatarchaeota archaeon]
MDANVIFVLWKRQLKRYFRSRSRMIGSVAQPLLFLFAFGFGFSSVFQQAGQGNYFQFLAPGIVSMAILFTSIFTGIEIIWDRQFGFLKETLVAPVSRLEIMIGKTLGGATVASLQGIIVIGISLLVGFVPYSLVMIPVAFAFMFLIATLFAAIGTAIASLLEDMQGFQLIMNFFVMPIFFLSGALFPLEGLLEVVGILSKVNPLSYGVDGIRSALTGVSYFGFAIDFAVLGVSTAVCLAVGSYLFSKMQI